MHNDLFRIGNFTVHGYGLMIAIGILVADYMIGRQAKKHNLQTEKLDGLILAALIYGFIGSKIVYILTNIQGVLANPAAYIVNGWVVYGGIIGGLFGGIHYCKKHGLDPNKYVNLVFPEVALAQAFGRVGCFMAGCCYGKVCYAPFANTFPAQSLAPAGIPLYPTQLMSSAGDFILFIILYRIYNNSNHPEETAAWYMILYSIGRFGIEFLRGDTERGFIGVLSTSQFLALFVLAFGIIWIYRNRKALKENVEVKE